MNLLSISPHPFWDHEDRKGMPSIYLGHKQFVDAGHRVVFAYAGARNRTYDVDGVSMVEFTVPFPVVPPRHIWWHRLSLKLYYFAFIVTAARVALRCTRDFKPDVIYGQFLQAAPVAWFLGRRFGVPNITRMYGTFLYPWLQPFWKRLLRYEDVLAFKIPCRYMIMTNDGTRGDECAAFLGMPPGRLRFWRNGVDKWRFDEPVDTDAVRAAAGVPPGDIMLLALCRLEKWKGVDRLIAAMPEVLRRHPRATAVIVGDGEERDALERQAHDIGVADRVRFLGAIHHDQTPPLLLATDIFVSLYKLSNVGNPLLEALCAGACIVTVNNGATGKLIGHGETGTLIDESRLETLPDVLSSLAMDPEARARFGAAARRYADQHLKTWPERCAMEVRLIEDLVGVTREVA